MLFVDVYLECIWFTMVAASATLNYLVAAAESSMRTVLGGDVYLCLPGHHRRSAYPVKGHVTGMYSFGNTNINSCTFLTWMLNPGTPGRFGNHLEFGSQDRCSHYRPVFVKSLCPFKQTHQDQAPQGWPPSMNIVSKRVPTLGHGTTLSTLWCIGHL